MYPVTHFDKRCANTVNNAVEAALKKVAEEFGLRVVRETGRFSKVDFRVKYQFKVIGSATGEPASFKRDAAMLGFPNVNYGATFSTLDGTYKVIDFRMRRRRYPVLGKSLVDGKEMLFTTTVLSAAKNP